MSDVMEPHSKSNEVSDFVGTIAVPTSSPSHGNDALSISKNNVSVSSASAQAKEPSLEEISRSNPAHKERLSLISRTIGDEVQFFAVVQSKKFYVQCLLCKIILHGTGLKNHVTELNHVRQKRKNPELNFAGEPVPTLSSTGQFYSSSSSSSSRKIDSIPDCTAMNTDVSQLASASNLSEKSNIIFAKLFDSLENNGHAFGSNLKFKPLCYEGDSLSNTLLKNLIGLCDEVGCQMKYFSVRKCKGPRFLCLLCNELTRSKKLKGHVKERGHLLNVAKMNDPALIPQHFHEEISNLSEEDKQLLVYFHGSQDFVCTLCDKILLPSKNKFEHFLREEHLIKLKVANNLNDTNGSLFNLSNKSKSMSKDGGRNNHQGLERNVLFSNETENPLASEEENCPIRSCFGTSPCNDPKFVRSCLEQEFVYLCEKLDSQMDYFVIHSDAQQKKLKMTCTLCKVTLLGVSCIETHITHEEHIQRVVFNHLNEDFKVDLKFSPIHRRYKCAVCNELLPEKTRSVKSVQHNHYASFLQDLWCSHFKSSNHNRNIRILKSFTDIHDTKSNKHATMNPLLSGFDPLIKQKTDQPEPALDYISQEGTHESIYVQSSRSNKYNGKFHEDGFVDDTMINITYEFLLFEVSHVIDSDDKNGAVSSKSCGVSISKPETIQHARSMVSSCYLLNFEDLQFLKPVHGIEFASLIKLINNEVVYFLVTLSPGNEELALYCLVCNDWLHSLSEVRKHIRKKNHIQKTCNSSLALAALPVVGKRNWSYLEYNPFSGSYLCSLCKVQFSNTFNAWVKHFQSEDHNLKSRELILCSRRSPGIRQLKKDKSLVTFSGSQKSDSDFGEQYINIFLSTETAFCLSSSPFSRNISEFESLVFEHSSHKDEYIKFLGQIHGQVRFFQIKSEHWRKNLRVICLLCNSNMAAKSALRHVTASDHLVNMIIPFVEEENRMFLHTSSLISCSLCKVPLYKYDCLWFEHFQSELHHSKLREFHSRYSNTCEKTSSMVSENQQH